MSSNPAEVYLDVAQRVSDEENYQIGQAKTDLDRILHVCADLIRENASLKTKLFTKQQYVEQLELDVFEKDIELFSAINQLNNPEGGVLV